MDIKVNSNKNLNECLKMLAWIEVCGSIGHSCQNFEVSVDGDGTGQVCFEFDDSELKRKYNKMKKDLIKEYNENHNDLKKIIFD